MKNRDHFVQLYENDDSLLRPLAEYIADGLWQGQRVLVVTTGAHRAALEERLRGTGIDIASAIVTHQYVVADAEETLDRCTIGGKPNAAQFHTYLGEIVRSIVRGARSMRAFGEMAALLWIRGDHEGAIALEKLWDQLASKTGFMQFCAYPVTCFRGQPNMGGLWDVCHVHSRVIPVYS
jgi:hypothetical protein